MGYERAVRFNRKVYIELDSFGESKGHASAFQKLLTFLGLTTSEEQDAWADENIDKVQFGYVYDTNRLEETFHTDDSWTEDDLRDRIENRKSARNYRKENECS